MRLQKSQLTPEEHGKIQQALIWLGFLNDPVDGEFGRDTRAAIKRFQTHSGFPESEFLTAQERQQLLQEKAPTETAQAHCQVTDPTGTPLNIRSSPSGEITGTVTNGLQVHLVRTEQDTSGRSWSLIEQVGDDRTLGWVYREYIDCASVNTGGPQKLAQQPPPQPAPPPKDTAELKEARPFLEDAKKFIAGQQAVPTISAIANEAANLQIAVDKFDDGCFQKRTSAMKRALGDVTLLTMLGNMRG